MTNKELILKILEEVENIERVLKSKIDCFDGSEDGLHVRLGVEFMKHDTFKYLVSLIEFIKITEENHDTK